MPIWSGRPRLSFPPMKAHPAPNMSPRARCLPPIASPDADTHAPMPAFARRRLSIRVLHLLGAICPLCNGLGCAECADSGLR